MLLAHASAKKEIEEEKDEALPTLYIVIDCPTVCCMIELFLSFFPAFRMGGRIALLCLIVVLFARFARELHVINISLLLFLA